ncbi:MAG: 30S ribosomal protein S3 [Chloroflexi bacterium]|nr:30S ribosomal protein S3 [Chloroflexota bacterium]
MGRKINPIGFRLGIIKDWESKWFAEGKEYSKLLVSDIAIRKLIRDRLGRAGISRIEIQRFPKRLRVTIVTAKPGVVIGRRGANVNALKQELEALTGIEGKNLRLDVTEVRNVDTDAALVAESIAEQLERRVSQKRAMRQAMIRAMRSGAKGIKIECSGRLSGSEMARREWVREGRVPLHTLRADIDYALAESLTGFGRIGVKVWVYHGDVLPDARAAASVPESA